MNNKEKKPKRPIGPFSFCPKHNVFFVSCKCSYSRKKDAAEKEDDSYVEDNKK